MHVAPLSPLRPQVASCHRNGPRPLVKRGTGGWAGAFPDPYVFGLLRGVPMESKYSRVTLKTIGASSSNPMRSSR